MYPIPPDERDWRDLVWNVLRDAEEACMRVHLSEKVLGFDENAQVYLEIANEMKANGTWFYQTFR
jgi:hypothetical protein